MAREFNKITARVWRDKKFKAVSEGARLVYVYLMTNAHQNACGCCRLPDEYGASDNDMTLERFRTLIAELVQGGLIQVDGETQEIYPFDWFNVNPSISPDYHKNVLGFLYQIESATLRAKVEADLDAHRSAVTEQLQRERDMKESRGRPNGEYRQGRV